MKKRIISLALAIIMLLGMLAIPASAASPKASVTTGKYVTIKNVGTGKYLNVYGSRSANNTNITVYQADGTSGQDFCFSKNGAGYMLTPRCASRSAVNVYGYRTVAGSNLCVWGKSYSDTQTFLIEAVNGGYIFRSANNPTYVITATGSSNSSNVNLQAYNGSSYQIWTSSALSTSSSGGNVSYNKVNYQQYDSRWGNLKYGGLTMTNSGCGILAIVNAVANLPGTTVNNGSISPTNAVKQVAQWGYDAGYFNRYDGGCYSSIVSAAAKKFGGTYGFKYVGSGSSAYDQKLLNHLANGGTAVAHVYQHYICLAGCSNGNILVIDPAANCGRRVGLTSIGTNCWKTPYELTYGSYAIKVDSYWLFSKT